MEGEVTELEGKKGGFLVRFEGKKGSSLVTLEGKESIVAQDCLDVGRDGGVE